MTPRALLYAAQVNVVELFSHHDPDSVAFVCEDESQTYGQLTSRVATARTELATLAKMGSNIIVMGESSLLFIETLFAALSAGLPVVPLHPRYPKGEVERAVQLTRPVLIISTDDASQNLVQGLGVDHLAASALFRNASRTPIAVSYTHLRAHET